MAKQRAWQRRRDADLLAKVDAGLEGRAESFYEARQAGLTVCRRCEDEILCVCDRDHALRQVDPARTWS